MAWQCTWGIMLTWLWSHCLVLLTWLSVASMGLTRRRCMAYNGLSRLLRRPSMLWRGSRVSRCCVARRLVNCVLLGRWGMVARWWSCVNWRCRGRGLLHNNNWLSVSRSWWSMAGWGLVGWITLGSRRLLVRLTILLRWRPLWRRLISHRRARWSMGWNILRKSKLWSCWWWRLEPRGWMLGVCLYPRWRSIHHRWPLTRRRSLKSMWRTLITWSWWRSTHLRTRRWPSNQLIGVLLQSYKSYLLINRTWSSIILVILIWHWPKSAHWSINTRSREPLLSSRSTHALILRRWPPE